MTQDAAPVVEVRAVDSALEMLQLSRLHDIVYFEISAKLHTDEDAERKPEDEVVTNIAVRVSDEPERLEARCRLSVDNGEIAVVVDAASRFEFSEPIAPSDEAKTEFVKRVAIMAVYPYIREAVHQAGAKLRVDAPLLDLLRGDEVELEPMPPPGAPSFDD